MSVTDNTRTPEQVSFSVISNGDIRRIKANICDSIEVVLGKALVAFCINTDTSSATGKLPTDYKLISASNRQVLKNENFLYEIDIKNEEQLLLVPRRKPPIRERLTEDMVRSPTAAEIEEASRNVEAKNANRRYPDECSADFYRELRKVFISLAEVSAIILTPSAKSDEIIAMLRESLSNDATPDLELIQQLLGMGFSEAAVVSAMYENRLNRAETFDRMLGGNADQQDNMEAGSSARPKARGNAEKMTVSQYVDSLLNLFRKFKRRDFQISPKALQNLKAMGFEDESDIREALLITGNNQIAACEWLLGERRPSLEDLDKGMDINSALYNGIMDDPDIQLNLSKPRMLLAFLNMIQDSGMIVKWLRDVDGSPVLNIIFNIYHREKHSSVH